MELHNLYNQILGMFNVAWQSFKDKNDNEFVEHKMLSILKVVYVIII